MLGAALAWTLTIPQRVIAGIMAFGSGVLVSALSFELVDEAWGRAGLAPVVIGLLGGTLVYSGVNVLLAQKGARDRKRSGDQHSDGNSTAIAVGALLDGVPESIVIGVSLLGGHGVSVTTVVAIFLSNLPEGLSSAAGMRKAGRSARYVFGVWGSIALASGVSAIVGNLLFAGLPAGIVAATQAAAAGAILTMLADTMIPEAFEEAHDFAGLLTVAGFVASFALSRAG